MRPRVLAQYLLWQIYSELLPDLWQDEEPPLPTPSDSDGEETSQELRHLHRSLSIFKQYLAWDRVR